MDTETPPSPPPEKYLIRCAGGERYNECLWWAPERRGYTSDIDRAGRYSKEEAEEQQGSRPDMDVAVPESAALAKVRRVVMRDSLPWMPPRPEKKRRRS